MHLHTTPPFYRRLMDLADRNPRRIVALVQRHLGRIASADRLLRTWASFALGYALVRWERPKEAEPVLQQAHDEFVAQGLEIPALHARRELLRARLLHGAGLELQLACEDLAAAYTTRALYLAAAHVRFIQIVHLNILGRPQLANDLAQRTAPVIAAEGAPFDQAWLLRITGVTHTDMGALDQASALIDQAAQRFAAIGQPLELAKTLTERARVGLLREDFVVPLADLERALAIFHRLNLPLRIALCDKQIALIAGLLGRYDESIAGALRARDRFAALGRRDHIAECDLNLGNTAYYSGLFDLALAAYRRAQREFEAVDFQRMALISRRNQALALRLQGRPAAALERLNALVAPVTALGERMELAEIANAQGLALRDLRQYAAAMEAFQQAEYQFAAIGNLPGAAESRLEQGWLYLEQQDLAAAAERFAAARPALANRPAHQWRADYGLGRCAELQGQPEIALDHYRQASATITGLRQRLASAHASSGIFRQAEQLARAALRLALRHGDPRVLLDLAEQQRAMALQRQMVAAVLAPPDDLRAAYEQQRDHLRALIAADADADSLDAALTDYTSLLLQARHRQPLPSDLPLAALDLAALRAAFSAAYPAGWTAMVYVFCDDTLAIITIDAHHETIATTPFDERLRQLLEQVSLPRYRQYTYLDYPYLRGQTTMPWENLAELGARLLPPTLEARLDPAHRLLIVASGPLHSIPWAALRFGDAWLCQRAVIQLVPGLRFWPALAARTAPPAALLLGVSRFGGRAPDLANVGPSLDLVQSHWPGPVTRLEDAAVTRETLLDWAARGELRRYGLLHIATHGQLAAARGLLAHLKLSNDDLFSDDVARLGLDGALAVLAACEGASVEVLPGEEVLSLNWALLAAGARDVIASLWQLYDQAVIAMLEPLYQALAEGADAPSALARAQRALIAQALSAEAEPAMLALPFVWASLCVIGAGTCGVAPAGDVLPAANHLAFTDEA